MGIFDSLLGKTASNAAISGSQATAGGIADAGKDLRKAGDTYAAGMSSLADRFNPYVSAGTGALGMLQSGLGLNGGQGTADFTAAYRGLPGYQNALQTGQDSLSAQLNASGRLNTGAAQKAAIQYGQNFEDQRSGDYLTRLMGLSGMGQQATGQQVATAGQGLQGQLGTRTTAYGGDVAGAQALGQGQVAAANAEQSALTNLMGAGAYLGGAALGGPAGTSLAGLFKPKPASGPALGGGIWAGL